MRLPMIACLTLAMLAAPAEAAQVVLKDGHTLSGTVKVEGAGLEVKGADGKVQLVPFAELQGVSLDDQPLYAQAPTAGESKLFNNDWLVWTAVGANVATMVVGAVMLYRASTQAAPAR